MLGGVIILLLIGISLFADNAKVGKSLSLKCTPYVNIIRYEIRLEQRQGSCYIERSKH